MVQESNSNDHFSVSYDSGYGTFDITLRHLTYMEMAQLMRATEYGHSKERSELARMIAIQTEPNLFPTETISPYEMENFNRRINAMRNMRELMVEVYVEANRVKDVEDAEVEKEQTSGEGE